MLLRGGHLCHQRDYASSTPPRAGSLISSTCRFHGVAALLLRGRSMQTVDGERDTHLMSPFQFMTGCSSEGWRGF